MLRLEGSALLLWVENDVVTVLLSPNTNWEFVCVMAPLDCVVTVAWPDPAAAALPFVATATAAASLCIGAAASLCIGAAFAVTTVTAQHLVTTQVVTTGQHVTTGHGQQQHAAVVQLVH